MLKSPGLKISASGNSITFLPSDPNELCEKPKISIQEKKAENNSDLVIQAIVAIDDNLLENKCISRKQRKQLLINCNLLHK